MSTGSTMRRQRAKPPLTRRRPRPDHDTDSQVISYPALGVELSASMIPLTLQSLRARVATDGRLPRTSHAARLVIALYRDGHCCRGWVDELVSD